MNNLKTQIEQHKKLIDEVFDETSELIDIYGLSLDDALKNQLLLQINWERVNKKSRYLFSQCELLVDEKFAKAFKHEISNSYKNVSTTEAREFAKCDADYLDARRLLIDAAELKDETTGLLDVITSRKYVLNNLTNAIISACNKEIL